MAQRDPRVAVTADPEQSGKSPGPQASAGKDGGQGRCHRAAAPPSPASSRLSSTAWGGQDPPSAPTVAAQSQIQLRGDGEDGGGAPHRMRFWRMRGTMQEGGPALPRKGCFKSSLAVARCTGSRTSMRSRKPLREGET